MKTTLRFLCFGIVAALAACGPSGSGAIDSGNHTDAPPYFPDSFGGPNFGELCTTSSDCGPGGYCVSSQNGNICTYGCDAGCPDYYHCRATDINGKLESLCLPLQFDFCKPCTGDAACDGGICVQLEGAGYCLPPCPFEGTCPMGYSCGTDPTNTHQGSYCVPNTGSCTCNAMQSGQIRSCENTNAIGTCRGTETCMPDNGGWSACSASTASTEVCDGKDNDCDQLIDDGLSGSQCDVPSSFGACKGTMICNGSSVTCTGTPAVAETCNYADDNCDGQVDELWPTLTQVCSAGMGGCQRFGVNRCNTAGDNVECSVTAGAPVGESCNTLDDDCDGMVDENFKPGFTNPVPTNPLGTSCTVGVGACQRSGNYVCAAGGAGTTCSVTPGTPGATETCNGLDDNCNSQIDEGFLNQGTNQYDQNTACGSCSVDCTQLYNLPNATGVCSTASGSPTCGMQCQPNAFDLDNATSNGCELVLDPQAIYVSTDDTHGADDNGCGLGPYGTGAGNYPCLSIAQGITRAAATSRIRIRVANGIYDETVTIPNGVSFLGGHRADNWVRDVAGTSTMITGVGTIAATAHDYTVRALGITSATSFDGFVVVGSVNAKVGGNSYAIYVTGATTALSVTNNIIFAGRGGPGSSGTTGSSGTNGADGTGRNGNASDTAYDSVEATAGTGECSSSNNRQAANGGTNTCGAVTVNGGNGGGNRCPAQSVCTSGTTTGCTGATWSENTAIDGAAGQAGGGGGGGAAGAGGYAGDDMFIYNSNAGVYCYIPPTDTDPDPDNTYGLNGANGGNGTNGSAGAGCPSLQVGTISSGHWIGATAGAGASGGNGGGGGGGGAGGGSKCDPASPNGGTKGSSPANYVGCTGGSGTTAYLDGKDKLGAHGGGGGAGACGGLGGGAATTGGGAFGIFIIGTGAPVITGNTINRGEGGVGGTGGAGGKGGVGGTGAGGGLDGGIFCTDVAGRGGNGGNGGHGAGGGGGCGGNSFGIMSQGIGSGGSAPNYCTGASPANTFQNGTGGAGGSGGYSISAVGGAGSIGIVGSCQFLP